MADPRDLMQRYQDGDASAFRELYSLVAPRLLGYLLKMARSRALAEDLVQQTFMKVHRARAAYVRGADPVPWIYSIAHRTFIDETRKTKRAIVNVAATDDALPEVVAGLDGEAEGRRDEPRADPELAKAALDALSQLPEAQREAVVLTRGPARGGRLDQARRKERRRGRRDRRNIRRRDEGPRAPRLRGTPQAPRWTQDRARTAQGGRGDVMSDPNDALGALAQAPPPAPPPLSAALEAELGTLSPVAPRRPLRQLMTLVSISLVYGAGLLAALTMRRDMSELPTSWIIGAALAWILGFAVPCYLALVPRPGAVTPRWRWAATSAIVTSILFVVLGLVVHPSGPSSGSYGWDNVGRGHTCLEIGLFTAIVPVIMGALFLRGALPVGSRWIAAALGAGGGCLGGLVLHMHCHIADAAHVGLIHGGVVLVAALISAAIVPRATDRPLR
jgi:RNA polymerase sigma factor (sigma-70 family)